MIRKLIFIFLGQILLFSLALQAQESPQVIDAYRKEPYGDKRFKKKGIMDGNLVRTMYYNQGEVGHWPDQPSGEWPKGTGHSYLDGVCLLVGAKVRVYVAGQETFITPMEAGYREWTDYDPATGELWEWQPVPGYANPVSEIPALSNEPKSWPELWPEAIFSYLNVSPTQWLNEAEVQGAEGIDDDKDGFIDNFTYWYGYFGRGVTNADLETFFVLDDSKDREWSRPPYNYFPLKSDLNRDGLGLRVETRGFQWSHVLAEDNIFWHYDIVNISDTTYDEAVFGFITDVGIGGTNDSGDDNASFDLKLDIAYGYDDNNIGSSDFGSWGPVGMMGYAYLESPGNSYNGIDDDEDGVIDERRDDGLDNDGDWQGFDDLNGNGAWDKGEPLNDDLGKDGVGPFDRQYKGPDEGEADAKPTAGEPNFDRTDKDESDQIGLTSMSIYRLVDGGGGDGWPKHDEGLWRRMTYHQFDTSLHRANIHMLFGSGPFVLKQGARERFSMALVYGDNFEDLVFNKVTVQEIYNSNYNFSKPPNKPLLYAVPGDKKVFLYWDNIAEESRDPVLRDSLGNPRKDFEGYLIYRSKEPEFQDIKLVTDSKAAPRYWKPIAQYDLVNGITGPDPIGINGAHFWRGSDTGLRHSFVDTDVQNGQKYYYAVVSYDQGDPNFGTQGLQPTECTKIIREDFTGNLVFVDINCAVVTPNAPAAGYIPPKVAGDLNKVYSGIGTGTMTVEVFEPGRVIEDASYKIEFKSVGTFPYYKTSTYSIFRMEGDSLVPVVKDFDATQLGIERPSPPVDGFVVTMQNDTGITVNTPACGWLKGNSNLDIKVQNHIRFKALAVPWPADYKITFYDNVVDTSYNFKIPVNFKVWNMTEDREVHFELWDNDNSKSLSIADQITIVEFVGGKYRFAYDIFYDPPRLINVIPILPKGGDEYIIQTLRPFNNGDYFKFTTSAAATDNVMAKKEMEKIKVVPNPYMVGATWEPRTLFGAGRGQRKIDFIHLPAKCTIRVFSVSGKLIKTIEHDSPVIDGSESWNLISDDGMEIAYGIYFFHVEAAEIGSHIGKFAVVK